MILQIGGAPGGLRAMRDKSGRIRYPWLSRDRKGAVLCISTLTAASRAIMVAVIAVNAMALILESATPEELAALVDELRRHLADHGSKRRRKLHEIALPDKLYRLLVRIVNDLAEGKAVSLTAAAQEMTTQRAADFLDVSRQYLVRLLDEGKIPFHRAGTHRRIYLQDMIAFRRERDRLRHEAIGQMARDAVAAGIYDEF